MFNTNITNYLIIKNIVFFKLCLVLQKQKQINGINETIVEKTLDLNDIREEETRLERVERLLSDQNEISFDAIRDQLRQSLNDS